MSPAFTTRRRADTFDALLADPASGADDARFGELLELVGQLRAVPDAQPRSDFSTSLREQLMVEADTVLLPRDRSADARLTLPARAHRRSPRDRRLAVAAGALAMVGATTSMAVAAQTALPGDTLYGVKRAIEDAHTGVSIGDAARGTTLLANATGRLDETSELARMGDAASLASAPDTLTDFVAQAEQGSALLMAAYEADGEAASIETVRDFTGDSLSTLAQLDGTLPESSDAALQRAAGVLADIDVAAADLCATCGGLGIGDIPPSLLSSADVATDDPVTPSTDGPIVIGGREAERSGSGSGSASGSGSQDQGSGSTGGQSSGQQSGQPDLPDVDGGDLGPGSVLTNGPSEDEGGALGGLAGDLLGGQAGGSTSQGNGGAGGGPLDPVKPLTDPLGQQVEDTLDGVVGGLTGQQPGSGSQGSGSQGSGSQGSGSQGSGSQGSGSGSGSNGGGGVLGDLLD